MGSPALDEFCGGFAGMCLQDKPAELMGDVLTAFLV